MYAIPRINDIPDTIIRRKDNFEPSDKAFTKKDRAMAGAADIKIIWIKALDGSTVVRGPVEFGPIKKLKNENDTKIKRITKPKIEIDNHSPVFNILFDYLCINIYFMGKRFSIFFNFCFKYLYAYILFCILVNF